MPDSKDEQFLALARQRFKRCVDAERENREEAKIDLKFVLGEQWDETVKRQRESGPNPRPALVFTKLDGPIQQVANEARQNKPAIKAAPISGGATKDTSDVIEGVIRHITYASNGNVACETALESAVRCGMGFFGFLTRYVDDEGFDQEIVFRALQDPFAVYLDPDAKEPDKSDAQYAFVIERLSKDEFRRKYPKSEAEQENFFAGVDTPAAEWFGEQVMVAEYWHVEYERKTITRGKLSRAVEIPTVRQDIVNGVEILESNEWAGKHIPIVAVYGPEIVIEGKTHRLSLPRKARDPQRLHNYYKSVEAETIGLAPRPKWKGAVGQFKSRLADFNNPNALTVQYDVVSTNGGLVPPPTWESFEPPVQALSLGAMQSADDIKAATNIFDASLGARSNETSGKAIDARKYESDMANSHYLDNLNRAMTYAGKQLIDLIPKIYDTPREVMILGEDEAQKVVMVNQPYQDPETGKISTHMLSRGRYGVTATTGPSYTTKRKESFELFSDMARAYPALMQMGGDIIFRNSDIPGADVLADRFKRSLPPNLQDQTDQNPRQARQQLAQAHAMIEQLTAAVHQLSAAAETKAAELASRERIALGNQKAGIIEAAMRAQSAEAQAAFQADLAHIDRQLAMIPDPALEQQGEMRQSAAEQQARQNQDPEQAVQ